MADDRVVIVFGAEFGDLTAAVQQVKDLVLSLGPSVKAVGDDFVQTTAQFGKGPESAVSAWQQAARSLQSTFDGMLNGVLLGTQTWQQALARLFSNVAVSFADMVVNMAIQWAATGLGAAVSSGGIFGALAGIAIRGMDVNIFVQIGFVVLVGLACKNAILIVEFARDRQQEGASRFDAVVAAALTRLRPILMTSACFVHMVPPYFAAGAGAEMRRSLGTAVLWGAFGVTLFGIFLTPVFFYVVRWFSGPGAVRHAPPAVNGSSVIAHDVTVDSLR